MTREEERRPIRSIARVVHPSGKRVTFARRRRHTRALLFTTLAASLLVGGQAVAQTDQSAPGDPGRKEAPTTVATDPVGAAHGGGPVQPASSAAPRPPPAPAPDIGSAPSFSSDPFGAAAAATDLTLKAYGDTGFSVRDNANMPWQTSTSNPNVYAPGVATAFYAPRLDLFASANIEKLSFLAEMMFEGYNNSIGIDVERVQISYLFRDWLRVTAGRSHLAWGYYNDTYHHGNIFELTTSRPYSVNFEDSDGIILSHLVGVGIDGTIKLGPTLFRYDAEVGNPRSADITAVPVEYAEGKAPTLNARLRWMPVDGLIIGVNGMRDVIPSLAAPAGTVPAVALRPLTEELVGGAHVVYTEHHLLVDIEAFYMKHNPVGAASTDIAGGFAELGYTLGAFTPYVRPEYMRFPAGGDPVFQYVATDPQGMIVGQDSIYAGIRDFADVRVGVKWMVIPQLALKVEGDRVSRDGQHQEIAGIKAAFGF